MPGFDWLGAATFGHWSFSGFGRVGYSILQTLMSCAILGILGLIITMVIDIVSTPSTSSTTIIVHESKLEGFNKMISNEDAVSTTTNKSTTDVSGPVMFFGFIFSVAAWIWTVSFSAACYEHWRGLAPTDETQKMLESGNKPK